LSRRDLEALIRSLGNSSLPEIMRALDAEASAAEATARRRGEDRAKKQTARAHAERIARVLYFLHHGTSAFGATAEDNRLCGQIERQQKRLGN
jgi:hypothetical protein